MPIFSRVTSGYPIGSIVTILLNDDIDTKKVSHVQPLGVSEKHPLLLMLKVLIFKTSRLMIGPLQEQKLAISVFHQET